MKFVHIADCHVGAWRDPKMRELTHEAFTATIERTLALQPAFLLIAGDLFNTAIPGVDSLKLVVKELQRVKEANIPVYCIAGSHDFSPSGKTMLDVLEEAGLLKDVMRGDVTEADKLALTFTEDPQTSVKLTGILGRKGSLDRSYYEDLDLTSLENEPGKKIFLFHTSITELKPKDLEQMDSQPVSFMPKGFDYYAGGHVHITNEITMPGYTNVVYPGPVFPASFSELEKLKHGSMCVVDMGTGSAGNATDWQMTREDIIVKDTLSLVVDALGKTPEKVHEALEKELKGDLKEKIVLIRVHGELREGKVGDIDFRKIFMHAYDKGAYFVMKNTTKLTSPEFEEITSSGASPDEVEEHLIKEHLGQQPMGLDDKQELALTQELMHALSQPQLDGEKKYEYEERVKKAGEELLRDRKK